MAPTKTSLALLFVDKKTVAIGVVVLIISFALGIIIGYFGRGDGNESSIVDDIVLERYVTDQFQTNQVNTKPIIDSCYYLLKRSTDVSV